MNTTRTLSCILFSLGLASGIRSQQHFAGPADFPVFLGGAPAFSGQRLIVGDIDKDRDPDFIDCGLNTIVCNGVPGLLNAPHEGLVFFNSAVQASFTTPSNTTFSTFNNPNSGMIPLGRLEDMDNDGDRDLIVACQFSQTNPSQNIWCVAVFENVISTTGTYAFALTAAFVPGEVSGMTGLPRSLAVVDLDLDGFRDVVVGGNTTGLRIFKNAASGPNRALVDVTSLVVPTSFPFNNPAIDLAVGDYDVNGTIDIAIATGLPYGATSESYVALGNGSLTSQWTAGPTFNPNPVPAGPNPIFGHWCIAMGDLDGTGNLDVVIGSRGHLRAFFAPGTQGVDVVGLSTSDFTAVTIGDVDGDATNDIVCSRINVAAATAERPLVIRNATGLTSGNWTFLSNNHDCRSVELADLDFDGDLDIVLSQTTVANGGGLYRNHQLDVSGTAIRDLPNSKWDLTVTMACDETYTVGGGTAFLFATFSPISFGFGGSPFPIVPVPIDPLQPWQPIGTFALPGPGPAPTIPGVASAPFQIGFPGSTYPGPIPIYLSALMFSTFSNTLRISNVAQVVLP